MERVKSNDLKVSGSGETEVEVKLEIKEEFWGVEDGVHSEEMIVNNGVERFSNCSEAIARLSKDIRLQSRCRLCALPNNNMIDIFDSYKIEDDIVEQIKYCLRIVVKETDTLPKQACQSCLEKLELCYQFNKIVAEAEKQLLDIDRQTSIELEEFENCNLTSICKAFCDATAHNDTETTLQTSSGMNMVQTRSGVNQLDEIDTDKGLASSSYCGMKEKSGSKGKKNRHHDPKRSYECFMCRKHFDAASELKRHKAVHTQNEDYRCTTCNIVFINESRMKSHMVVHSREKLWQCDNCEKRYNSKSGFKRHLVWCKEPPDNRERLYKCDSCAKSFMTRGGLLKHNKFHTGEKLHSCDYCGKKFAYKAERDQHHRIHTQERSFKCFICEKMFTRRQQLKQHASVHSEERNYSCSVCNISFKTSSVRGRHMLVHTNERPWECDHCKKSYKLKKYLRVHLRICKKRY